MYLFLMLCLLPALAMAAEVPVSAPVVASWERTMNIQNATCDLGDLVEVLRHILVPISTDIDYSHPLTPLPLEPLPAEPTDMDRRAHAMATTWAVFQACADTFAISQKGGQ